MTSFTVDPVEGERLDVALGRHPDVGSRAAAVKLIDAGAVTVDGRPRQKRHLLTGRETIEVTPPVPPPPAPSTNSTAAGTFFMSGTKKVT